MSMLTYIKSHREWIACQAGVIILINLILLTSTPLSKTLGEIFYLDLLVILITGAGLVLHFRRLHQTYTQIKRAMAQNLDLDLYFNQPASENRTADYRDVPGITIMKELLEYKNISFSQKENDYQQRMNDLKDYLTQTVHDLKVNLAVCEMVVKRLENEPGYDPQAHGLTIANKLLFQIEQMKFRVNQALAITRANHYSEDISAEKIDLSRVVKEAIADNSEFFIQKNISIQNNITPYYFISDKKWVHYIISQILNNSSKYTKRNGEIKITGKEDEWGYHLHLRDNGIGIPEEEISRVFNKGFTGSNGRFNTKSTGMGLYYAKKMADILGLGLQVTSRQGEYTEFIISFYKLSDYLQRQQTSEPCNSNILTLTLGDKKVT